MEKRSTQNEQSAAKRPSRKMTEYGRQLGEKQKVKHMYGMRERQFRRFYAEAVHTIGAPGENLLSFLERRLDNVIYRLKFASSRSQSRQMIVHGHIAVNGKRVYSPSFRVCVSDIVSLDPKVAAMQGFMEQVIDKRLKTGIKVPEWLELDKKNYTGRILRNPVRADIQAPIEEQLIVALYSK